MLYLDIHTPQYQYLLASYTEYLRTLGYAGPTVQSWPIHLREFLHYLEQQGITGIHTLESGHISDFVAYLKRRRNRSKAGALSSSSINKIINAVNVFVKFLNTTGKYTVESTAQRAETNIGERVILHVTELKQLYEATFLPQRQHPVAMGQRDRAIIAVFYGCGLRRSEGAALDVTDIDLQKNLLFVRKGKGNKQRYVPIAARHVQDIKDYLQEGRDWFLYHHRDHYNHRVKGKPYEKKPRADDSAFFVSMSGGRMGGSGFESRLKRMRNRAGIEKAVTLHGLRHSIATHLLQSGMDLEEIAKFLGHSSLAATQIYTHIVNEMPGREL